MVPASIRSGSVQGGRSPFLTAASQKKKSLKKPQSRGQRTNTHKGLKPPHPYALNYSILGSFEPYFVDMPPDAQFGHLHPISSLIREANQIFLCKAFTLSLGALFDV